MKRRSILLGFTLVTLCAILLLPQVAEPMGCLFCHNFHSAPGQAILKQYRVEAVCLSCHVPGNAAGYPEADVHTNDSGSAYDAFRISCQQCHNPHSWQSQDNWLVGEQSHPGGDHSDPDIVPGVNIKLLGTRANDNLIQDSNALDSASWVKNNVTVTADATEDPNTLILTSTTAEQIIATGSASLTDIQQITDDLGSVGGKTFTFYVWLKAETGTTKDIEISIISGGEENSEVVTVPDEWGRFYVRMTIPSCTPCYVTVAIGVDEDRDDGATTGESVYAWGARLEELPSSPLARIQTPNSGVKYVVFEQRGRDITGEKLHSFSDEDEDNYDGGGVQAKDGICEVCHTATKHHCNGDAGNTGNCGTSHKTGLACTECHGHATNFQRN